MSSGILPINIDFNDWASQIRIDFPNIDIPIPPSDVNGWKGWASQIVNSNQLTNVPLPTETVYTEAGDWRKWGAYFINSVSLLGE